MKKTDTEDGYIITSENLKIDIGDPDHNSEGSLFLLKIDDINLVDCRDINLTKMEYSGVKSERMHVECVVNDNDIEHLLSVYEKEEKANVQAIIGKYLLERHIKISTLNFSKNETTNQMICRIVFDKS